MTALIRYTAMIEAAVTISLRVLRARRGRLWVTSVVPLLTRGTTLTIISKPVRPRAIWGNDQRAMRSQGQNAACADPTAEAPSAPAASPGGDGGGRWLATCARYRCGGSCR